MAKKALTQNTDNIARGWYPWITPDLDLLSYRNVATSHVQSRMHNFTQVSFRYLEMMLYQEQLKFLLKQLVLFSFISLLPSFCCNGKMMQDLVLFCHCTSMLKRCYILFPKKNSRNNQEYSTLHFCQLRKIIFKLQITVGSKKMFEIGLHAMH